MATRWTALLTAAAIATAAQTALGAPQQGDEGMSFDDPAPAAAEPAGTAPASDDAAFLDGQKTPEEQMLAAPAADESTSRAEDPGKPYYLVGLRLRWIMIPTWFIDMFGVDIQTNDGRHLLINNVGVGAEFTYRKDDFDITAAIWWAGLSWKDGVAFKESGEEPNSWEVVDNNLSALIFSADFIWSTPLADWFAITYGAGLGVGVPLAKNNSPFVRTESRSPDALSKCTEHDIGENPWCNTGEQYGEKYKLPTGIVPWVNFLVGMRFKPHRNVALYVDTGFGIGFQLGVRGGWVF